MGKILKINCDIGSILGLQDIYAQAMIPDYESTGWVRRDFTKGSYNDHIFDKMETHLRVPKYGIKKMKLVVCIGKTYAGKVDLSGIQTVSQALPYISLAHTQWNKDCEDVTFILNFVKYDNTSDMEIARSFDGLVASLLSSSNIPVNSYGKRVADRFESGLKPTSLAGMDGLRKEFATYVKDRNKGYFTPTQTDVGNWLNSKGINQGLMGRFDGALDTYNYANRFGLLTMGDEDFETWQNQAIQNGLARYIAGDLMALSGVAVDTALFDVGFVACEAVTYEALTYVLALFLI